MKDCPHGLGPIDMDSPNAGMKGDDLLLGLIPMHVRRGDRVWRERALADPIRCFCHEYVEINPKTGEPLQ